MVSKANNINTILITGGCGFVGSNLTIFLSRKGYDVVAMDNLRRRGSEHNINRIKKEGAAFHFGDIRNPEDYPDLKNLDIVIDCSAEPSVMSGYGSDPRYVVNTNLVGTINCLNYCLEKEAKMIFLSTSRVYPLDLLNDINTVEKETRFALSEDQTIVGFSDQGVEETFPIDGPRTLYGTTKLCSEYMIQEYSYTYKLESIINRCGVLAGPWQMGKVDQGVVALWVAAHFYKNPLNYIGFGGKGKQVRDILHIDDLCRLLDIQLDHFSDFNGTLHNVGGGVENSVSLLELTKLCQDVTGNEIPISSVSETRYGDIISYITNNNRITEKCEWHPEKSVKDVVDDTYKWLCENQELLVSNFKK